MIQTITCDTLILGNASQSSSAFGDIAVTNFTPTLQLNFIYNINTRLVNTTLVSDGTVTHNNSKAIIASGSTANSSATLLTHHILQHRAGQGAIFRSGGYFSTPVSTGTQLLGVGNGTDGLFFGYNGTTFGILRRQNSTDNWISQSSWNQDIMDGTGSYVINLYNSKGNLYQIQFQLLGFGIINFSIVNPISGRWILVHRIQYPNTTTDPSIFNPLLPGMCYAANGGTAADVSVNVASMLLGVEGNLSFNTGSIINATSVIPSSLTSEVPIISLRSMSSFQSKTNRVVLQPLIISIAADGNKPVIIKLYLTPTLTNSSFSNYSSNTSVAEIDTSATAFTGGTLIYSETVGKNLSSKIDISKYFIHIHSEEILTITCQSTSTNEPVISITWRELF